MKREKLLRSKEYWVVQIQNNLFGIIEDYMKKNKLNRTQLANELNVTKGYVTQVLKGDFDHKVSKLVELALFSGKVPILSFVDLEQYIMDDTENRNNSDKNIQFILSVDSNVSYMLDRNTYQVATQAFSRIVPTESMINGSEPALTDFSPFSRLNESQ